MTLKLIIFGAVGVFVIYTTLTDIRVNRSWALARSLAFLLNLALVLINLPYWGVEPFSPVQIVSWIFLGASLFMLFHGIVLLVKKGKPEGQFERTTELVTSGVYRFIRHPMYASLVYLTIGIVLKNPSLPVLVLGLFSLAAAYATARLEEKDTLAKFGPSYAEYMKGTRMFVPFVF